jgi:hypothetical protein
MASGTSRVVRGSFVGTGALLNVRTVGFRPRTVRLWNIDGLAKAHWQDGLPDAAAWKVITAGTQSYITSNGVTPLSNGFSLGADADLNVSGEVVHWEAVE